MNFVIFSVFKLSISAVLMTSERKCASPPALTEVASLFLDVLAIIDFENYCWRRNYNLSDNC